MGVEPKSLMTSLPYQTKTVSRQHVRLRCLVKLKCLANEWEEKKDRHAVAQEVHLRQPLLAKK